LQGFAGWRRAFSGRFAGVPVFERRRWRLREVTTGEVVHSSTLRTIEEIFGVTPMLGDAANATDLSDLFVSFP